MALANFFDKTLLAGASVLAGFDPTAFRNKLEAQALDILFDEQTVSSPEGRIALELSTNLAARLYPTIALIGPNSETIEHFVQVALSINPLIDISRKATGIGVRVNLSTAMRSGPQPTVHLGAHGWIAHVSSTTAPGWGDSINPFGGAVAACLGAANAFRIIFREQLVEANTDDTLDFSVYELQRKPHGSPSPLCGGGIGAVHLVGAGAIGNAVCWALSKVPGLKGSLNIIDPESVDLSNIQRYVVANQAAVGRPKTEVIKACFVGSTIEIYPHQKRWGDYFAEHADDPIKMVLCTLDSAEDRCTLQASLPCRLLNAWTQPDDLGISRHSFVDEDACLMCLCSPQGQTPSEDRLIANALGIPQAERLVRDMLYRNTPVTQEFLAEVAGAKAIPLEKLQRFVGKSLRAFHGEAICSGAILEFVSPANRTGRTDVPLAFQSALAGILLASELVIETSANPPIRRLPITAINVLKPMTDSLSLPRKKDPRGRCICQDRDYIEAYNRIHGTQEQSAKTEKTASEPTKV